MLATSVIRYIIMRMGLARVAISVVKETNMGPRYRRMNSSVSSIPAAALGGYSPPTPKPAMPRTTTKYHSMFIVGCTDSATVAINVPIATIDDVKSSPARRENISDAYPSTMIPIIAPMSSELLIRVFISEVKSVPSRCLKMTLVGLARPF